MPLAHEYWAHAYYWRTSYCGRPHFPLNERHASFPQPYNDTFHPTSVSFISEYVGTIDLVRGWASWSSTAAKACLNHKEDDHSLFPWFPSFLSVSLVWLRMEWQKRSLTLPTSVGLEKKWALAHWEEMLQSTLLSIATPSPIYRKISVLSNMNDVTAWQRIWVEGRWAVVVPMQFGHAWFSLTQ